MLKINEELRELIPPLSTEEKQLLTESILKEGCRDSLITWNNTIIDGHNRYQICKANNIAFKVQEMDFDNIGQVKNWMIKNQLARRNLTDSQRRYFIGKRYEEEKKSKLDNLIQFQDNPKAQSGTSVDTSQKIAKENNISKNTVIRNEEYSKAIDEIKKHQPEVAEKILNEEIRISNKDVITLSKHEPEEREKITEVIEKGEISVNKAYANIKNQEKKEALKVRAEEVAKEFKKDDLVEIIHDDCTNYLKTLEDNSIDLILLDPPYFGIVKDDWDNQWNSDEDFLNWCKEWMIECLRVLKPTGSFYIWGGVGEKSDILIHQKLLLDRLGFHFKDWITWKKRRGLGNRKGWLYTREECLWYVKDNNQFYWNEDEQYSNEKSDFTKGFSGYELKSEYKRITNVWDDIPEFIGNKGILHYTPKPIEAIERIIQTATKEGDIVLDVFAGSGTTGIASRNLNRKAILVENDINSINEIKRRLIDEL